MDDLTDEELRALHFAQLLRRRRAEQRRLAGALSGDSSQAESLRDKWEPVRKWLIERRQR